jgi:hypothetical protein
MTEREVYLAAFARCGKPKLINVPKLGEIPGERCFAFCSQLEKVEFEGSLRLENMGCKLELIIIPALTEEINGSAFVGCPLINLQIVPGNAKFRVEETEIMRCFGLGREVIMGKKARLMWKSWFEGCKHLGRILFRKRISTSPHLVANRW